MNKLGNAAVAVTGPDTSVAFFFWGIGNETQARLEGNRGNDEETEEAKAEEAADR